MKKDDNYDKQVKIEINALSTRCYSYSWPTASPHFNPIAGINRVLILQLSSIYFWWKYFFTNWKWMQTLKNEPKKPKSP